MRLGASPEFFELEDWLAVLISTYKKNPSIGLAETICFNLTQLLKHDDMTNLDNKRCDYLSMRSFWGWYANKP